MRYAIKGLQHAITVTTIVMFNLLILFVTSIYNLSLNTNQNIYSYLTLNWLLLLPNRITNEIHLQTNWIAIRLKFCDKLFKTRHKTEDKD